MSEIRDNKPQMAEDEVSLKELILKIQDWFKFVWGKWCFLLIAALIGGGIGFFYAKSKKAIYTATTTFVLEGTEKSGGLGQYAGMAAMVGIDLGTSGGGIFQGDNLLELYKSRKMIEAALLQYSVADPSKLLIDRYLELSGIKDVWKEKAPELLKIDFGQNENISSKRSRDSVIHEVVNVVNKRYLTVGPLNKKSSILMVEVASKDEIFAKEFNEAIVNEVNTFYIESKTKKSLDNIEILQQKVDSVRTVMYGNINVGASIIDATPNLNPTRQVQRIVPSQKAQFSAETNKVILSQLVQNLEMSKMTLMKEAPLIQKVDEPIYPLQKETSSKIKFGILGGLAFVFLMVFFFTIRYMLMDIGILSKRN